MSMKGKIFAARPDEHAHESTQWWHELFSKKKDRLPEDAVEELQRHLEKAPADIRVSDSQGLTVVHWAALTAGNSKKNLAMCKWLLENADIEDLNRRVQPGCSSPSKAPSYTSQDLLLPVAHFLEPFFPSSPKLIAGLDTMGSYDGETILHIFLVRKDFECLELLLRRRDVDLEARAYGSFFSAGNGYGTYYGEYPLSFVVSVDFREALFRLREYVDEHRLDMMKLLQLEDSYGNTALHMAVLHRRQWMHKWIAENYLTCAADARQQNGLGLTPFSLSAFCNDQEMFDYVLKAQMEVKWNFGPVTCFRLPMEEIDSMNQRHTQVALQVADGNKPWRTRGADGEAWSKADLQHDRYRSIMELVLHQRCGKIAAHPLIQELQDLKWNNFGRRVFILMSLMHVAKLVNLCLVIEYHQLVQDGKATSEDEVALHFFEVLCMIGALISASGFIADARCAFEASRLKHRIMDKERSDLLRPSKWITERDWKSLLLGMNQMTGGRAYRDIMMPVTWLDVLDWLGELALALHVLAYWGRGGTAGLVTSLTLSIGAFFAWHSAATMLIPWKHFGVSLIVIVKVLKVDVSTFLALLGFNAIASALALYILAPEYESKGEIMGGMQTPAQGIITMYRILLGEKPQWVLPPAFDDNSLTHVGYLPVLYYVIFTVTSAIVLLRLLISMFNRTFAKVWSTAQEQWRLEFGLLLLRIERRLAFVLPRARLERMTCIDDLAETGHSYVFTIGSGSDASDPWLGGKEDSATADHGLLRSKSAKDPDAHATMQLELSRLRSENANLRRLIHSLSRGEADDLS